VAFCDCFAIVFAVFIIIIIIIYLLRPWAAHKTYKDKKLKTTGTHTNKKR